MTHREDGSHREWVPDWWIYELYSSEKLYSQYWSWYICNRTWSYSWIQEAQNHPEFAPKGKLCYNCNISFFYRPMQSNRETSSVIHRTIRPPYQSDEVEFLWEYILIGLKKLKDIWKYINYEEMCDAIGDIPDTIYAVEWEKYWQNWKRKFQEKQKRGERNKIFNECIQEVCYRWLMPKRQSLAWLTWNFSAKIENLIKLNTSNKK